MYECVDTSDDTQYTCKCFFFSAAFARKRFLSSCSRKNNHYFATAVSGGSSTTRLASQPASASAGLRERCSSCTGRALLSINNSKKKNLFYAVDAVIRLEREGLVLNLGRSGTPESLRMNQTRTIFRHIGIVRDHRWKACDSTIKYSYASTDTVHIEHQ